MDHSSSTGPRERLRAPRSCLFLRRRKRAPTVGRLGTRGGCSSNARESRSPMRASASSRFLSCERCPWATTRTMPARLSRPPRRSRSRVRTTSGSDGDVTRSNRTSTRVSDVLTCCPPGPLDRDARISNSSRGMLSPRPITRRSPRSEGPSVSSFGLTSWFHRCAQCAEDSVLVFRLAPGPAVLSASPAGQAPAKCGHRYPAAAFRDGLPLQADGAGMEHERSRGIEVWSGHRVIHATTYPSSQPLRSAGRPDG